MAKFYDYVGFSKDYVEGNGEYEGVAMEHPIVERKYFGDIISHTRRWDNGSDTNDDLSMSNNKISILADDYANEHYFAIKYVVLMGARWKVANADPQRPRIILSLGGVYNGPTPGSSPLT